MSEDVTPIRQQYLDIKKNYPDTIVFFRLGDFYETFDNDAEITSRELDIVLTSRGVSKGQRIPMAGIPFHAVENYLSRLIDKGYHVAICEQVGVQPSKGLFPREVVRVVTPGTIYEPGLLKGDHNNYLAAVTYTEGRFGLAFVDISTGEFQCTESASPDPVNDLRSELIRLSAAEVLAPESLRLEELPTIHLTRLSDWRFESGRCRESILRNMDVSTLDGFGLEGAPLAIQSCGVILQYLRDTQPSALLLLRGITVYSTSEFMTLDAATQRNLELTETIRRGETRGSLLSILDHTITPMGHRLIRQWVGKPLLNLKQIQDRQNVVEFFLGNSMVRIGLRSLFTNFGDLERLSNRVVSGNALPRDPPGGFERYPQTLAGNTGRFTCHGTQPFVHSSKTFIFVLSAGFIGKLDPGRTPRRRCKTRASYKMVIQKN
jgi:DNA mismatch repair protein MutS